MIVKFFADLRDISKSKEIEMEAPQDIEALLNQLSILYGKKMKSRIIGEDNKLHPDMIVLLNGRHIEHLSGEASLLSESDVVSFFPRIAGG
ncbi:MAG: MoaD family protein [Eubacteriales bacterium]